MKAWMLFYVGLLVVGAFLVVSASYPLWTVMVEVSRVVAYVNNLGAY